MCVGFFHGGGCIYVYGEMGGGGGGGGSVREYEGVHKGGRCMLVLHVWVHFVHLG